MKIKYLKLRNWLLLVLMGALGFSGCKSSKQAAAQEPAEPQEPIKQEQPRKGPIDDDRGRAALMYGGPTLEFRVKGKVLNQQGKPVKGIQVMLLDRHFGDETPNAVNEDNPYVQQYVKENADTTAADGSFDVRVTDRPTEYMRVFVRDVDGPSNGNYQNDVINVEFSENEIRARGEGWNRGVAEKENMTIKIKPVR